MNGTYSKECVKDNLDTASHPFKLTMEIQERKGKQTCNEIVHDNLSKTAALKKLKPYNYTGDAKNTIINNAIARKEELEEAHVTNTEHKFPDYSINRRNNF